MNKERRSESSLKVGILALQGAVIEHIRMIRQCGCEAMEVKSVQDLDMVDRLIIPGGESTAIGKLARIYKIDKAIEEKGKKGMPIFGTCAGMILLARKINHSQKNWFNLINITVERNAFGRQVDSFEADLRIKGIQGKPFSAIFIRAPYIKEAGNDVEILAEFENKIVMVRQKNILVSSFHPELSNDLRIHNYFLSDKF